MKDRLANILIVFILVIVIGLAGMYAYKIFGKDMFDMEFVGHKIQETFSSEEQQNNTLANDKKTNNKSNKNQDTQSEQVVIPSIDKNDSSNNSKTEEIQTKHTNDYIYNNRYYYNQLDSYSKIIYDAIADNIGNLKYGNYVIDMSYDFAEVLKQENGQKMLNKYYDDAINAINLDVPNLFYINFSKMYLNIETTTSLFSTKYRLYINSGNNPNYFSTGFNTKEQVEASIKQVENVKKQICNMSNGDVYSKIRNSHDWIIENMEYDASRCTSSSVYGALIEKRALCEGYARVYKYILDELGVTSILVTGSATNSRGVTEQHMWNYVKLNDIWYAVDPTWDDPIVYGGGTASFKSKHKYFLIGSKELYKSHVEKSTISSSGKIFIIPKLSENNY